MTGPIAADPLRTWMQMIVLLIEASRAGYAEAEADRGIHSAALGAHTVAAGAIELMPPHRDRELDDIELDPNLAGASFGDLVRAAERASRRCPIEQFPVGASAVIVELCDLVGEVPA